MIQQANPVAAILGIWFMLALVLIAITLVVVWLMNPLHKNNDEEFDEDLGDEEEE